MKATGIKVTAARNFADCVNRAQYQNMAFVRRKNGKLFSRLEADQEKRCTRGDLARTLARGEGTAQEAREWQRDLQTARKAVKTPTDRCQ